MDYQPESLESAQMAALTALANEMASPGFELSSLLAEQLRIIDDALQTMQATNDGAGILWLRRLFNPLLARDTAIAIPQLQRLDERAIQVAETIADPATLASLLDERGRNLHKQGFHRQALTYFDRATAEYRNSDRQTQALHSYYMTASCHRALGNVDAAQAVLDEVFRQTDPDDPWLGNPLQVQGWLLRNAGKLAAAEATFRRALGLQRQLRDSDILVAGVLADIGEVLGLQGKIEEAKDFFQESLVILEKHHGQYNRHLARTSLKLAEVLIFERNHGTALQLLNSANDRLCAFNESAEGVGHYYDVLWRIELLQGLIYIQLGQLGNGLRKLRSAWRYRQTLGLSTLFLFTQLWTRLQATLQYQRNS
jgi:tetratricopeptide (TPR) repeat protein